MIQIGNKSLIHNQIEACLAQNINDFVFVLGYEIDKLKEHLLEILKPSQITFIENPIYRKTNTLYSLWLARSEFTDDFIYFNADILFDQQLLSKISSNNGVSELLLEKSSCAEEEVKMIINSDNRILEIGKKLDPVDCAGEFIGIGKFSKSVLPKFIEYLQFGVDNNESNNYFEFAVNLLAKDLELFAVSTDGIPCIEIDFPEDLERARTEIYPKLKHK